MKAIICKAFGPVDDLTLEEVPAPVAKADEVVIDIAAAGVNFPDSLLVQGKYQMKASKTHDLPLPFEPISNTSCAVSGISLMVRSVNRLRFCSRSSWIRTSLSC